MTKTIQRLLVVAAAVALICAAGCARRKGSVELAARLLRASEIHAVYVDAAVASYREAALREGRPKEEITCVENGVTAELMVPPLADAYAAEFSDEELRQAISFFESETGRAYVKYQRNLAWEMSGLPTEEDVPEFSPPEVERIKAFTETRLGKLVLTPNSPMFVSAKERLHQRIFPIFDECRKGR